MNHKKLQIWKKCMTTVLAVALTFVTTIPVSGIEQETPDTPAMVSSKEEAVYAVLDPDGKVNGIYAVNIFDLLSPGVIQDYGDYSSVSNLTGSHDIRVSDGQISVYTDQKRFYYQGNMDSTDLPWSFDIRYTLDQVSVSPGDLAGKSGHLEISIETNSNKTVNQAFYENYLLQITVTLDTEKCENIMAEGATLANAGKDKKITYSVMPGADALCSIKADVTDFEMNGIEITAIPFSMDIQMPDTSEMTDGLESLSDAIGQLNQGVSEIKSGIKELRDGIASLEGGSHTFGKGLNTLDAGGPELIKASKTIDQSLAIIASSVSSIDTKQLDQLGSLGEGLSQMSQGITELSGGLTQLHQGFEQGYAALKNAMAAIPQEPIPEADLQTLMRNNYGNKALERLLEYYKGALTVQATYAQVSPAFEGLNANLPGMIKSLQTISQSLEEVSKQLSASMSKNDLGDSLGKLAGGLSGLASNYGKFHTGLLEYTQGVSGLAKGYTEIDSGISGLYKGSAQLYEGANDLSEGSRELNNQAEKIPEKLEDAVERLINNYETKDFTPVSFTSDKNTGVSAVQFVIRTESIKIKEQPVQEKEQPKDTFWTRLKDLFRKQNGMM